MTPPAGATLLMPLSLLRAPVAPPSPWRTLRMDTMAGAARWAGTVRASNECCLLLDAEGRVVALSPWAATLLDLHPGTATGALLSDLLSFVDFSLAALSTPETAVDTPPLRALRTGGLARGLVRRRRANGELTTYDVIAVALDGRAGALAFVVEL